MSESKHLNFAIWKRNTFRGLIDFDHEYVPAHRHWHAPCVVCAHMPWYRLHTNAASFPRPKVRTGTRRTVLNGRQFQR